MMMTYILAHDVGTTGSKSCLYHVGDKITLIDSHLVEYPHYCLANCGVEQSADDWWRAICTATRTIMERSGIAPHQVKGISFCAQMQGAVFVDEKGEVLRPPMIYMDGRATQQKQRYLGDGPLGFSFLRLPRVLRSLHASCGVAATAKDPLWKYHWVRDHEPELFKRIHKWLDVKGYLTLRCTGRHVMTRDEANITFLFDTRPGKWGWHQGLCGIFDVDMNHLPEVITASDRIGPLGEQAARAMGLTAGIAVFGGGGDVAMTAVGSGAVEQFDTHVYVGTSGWVVSNVARRHVDPFNFITSIMGATPQFYNYVGEQETSGACMAWVRDHLALDEIGVYLAEHEAKGVECATDSLFAFMDEVIEKTAPGAGNVIFAPWLHGNRAPREDHLARGMFLNISLNTGKRHLIRAVLEGIAFHKRWILEAMEKNIPYRDSIRFVGGGAKSKVGCQIMADILKRRVETVENTQNVGTVGATVVAAIGLGLFKNFSEVKDHIPVVKVYEPDLERSPMYDRMFDVFSRLYEANKKLFHTLNNAEP
jgi:xylulokinase